MIENYFIIDIIDVSKTQDRKACNYQLTNHFGKEYPDENEIYTMPEFIACIWNGQTDPTPNQIERITYAIRNRYTPKKVYIGCWEITPRVQKEIDKWHERCVPTAIYERATRSYIADYKSQWDNLDLDITGNYSEERLTAHFTYKAFGYVFSAPPISDYQAENDITTFSHRPHNEVAEHIRNSDNHITKTITKPINYHISNTIIAPEKEIDTYIKYREFYIDEIENKHNMKWRDVYTDDYINCPHCKQDGKYYGVRIAFTDPQKIDYCPVCGKAIDKETAIKIYYTE